MNVLKPKASRLASILAPDWTPEQWIAFDAKTKRQQHELAEAWFWRELRARLDDPKRRKAVLLAVKESPRPADPVTGKRVPGRSGLTLPMLMEANFALHCADVLHPQKTRGARVREAAAMINLSVRQMQERLRQGRALLDDDGIPRAPNGK